MNRENTIRWLVVHIALQMRHVLQLQVEDFFSMYPEAGGGARNRQQALQNIRANISWMARSLADIVAWLADNVTPR